MNTKNNWYLISNIDSVDTPALALYPERIGQNIQTLLQTIDKVTRLRPHIKTHKSPEVIRMMMTAGITKFKCATIAEAEILGMEGAPDVLLAYQPVGPKAERLVNLIDQFPSTQYACLLDNNETAHELSQTMVNHHKAIRVFIDLNVGMNRTGIQTKDALSLIESCENLAGIIVVGLHAYDGHLRDTDLNVRKEKCDEAFKDVFRLQEHVLKKMGKDLIIVAGGTPTYSIHCKRKDVECSPGTFIYWDNGYAEILKEQHYLYAALVLSRVISKPTPDTICIDLGHKAIASENTITNRVTFLNAPNLTPTGHSEEHMVLKVEDSSLYNVGDVLYGVPFHICPTVALHQRPAIVQNNKVTAYWNTLSRSRMITV